MYRIASLAVLVLAIAAAPALAQGNYGFRPLTSVGVPGVAEIVDVSADGNTLVYTNSDAGSIGFFDISNAATPIFLQEIPVGGEPTSVSVNGDIAVAAVWLDKPDEDNPPPAFGPSTVVVFDLSTPNAPTVLGQIAIGFHPDSIKLTEINGDKVAVLAIENEPVVVENGLVTGDDEPGNPNDVSPAGFIQVITVDVANPASSTVVDVLLPPSVMTGLLYPNDPQPEFVDIDGTRAAVSLQENNGIAILDIANPAAPTLTTVFSLGSVTDRPADLIEDDDIRLDQLYPSDAPFENDGGGNPVAPGFRFPDAIAFTPDGQTILSADEGELNFSGGRGFSSWTPTGTFLGDDGGELERTAVRLSHYPEGRSENKGIEIEGVATDTYRGRDFAFITSERGSFMAIYRITANGLRLSQILATGVEPEGIVTIPSRDLVVTSDEESGTLSIFEGGFGPAFFFPSPKQPRLFSFNLDKPFAALSGLCEGGFGWLHAVPDNALPTKIYAIRPGGPFAPVFPIRTLKKDGQPINYDGEGICRDTSIRRTGPWWRPRGWWIASEGDSSSRPNLLVQVDFLGRVRREIQLPSSIDPAADPSVPGNAQGAAGGQTIRSNGFEGVAVSEDGRYLVACIQRDFTNEFPTGPRFARIARYDLSQSAASGNGRIGGDWEFFFVQLDSNDADNWAGLSEIVCIDDDKYMVIERDKELGLGSQLKKIYAFDLDGLTPDTDGVPDAGDTVTKVLVKDILADFFPYEKVEGMAVTRRGKLWVGLDNDGGEVESRLINFGSLQNLLP